MATFSTPAIRETIEVSLDVNKEIFIAKGTRTIQANWHRFYQPYVNLEELTLPEMKEGEKVFIKEIKKIDKETQPPNRFNQSSIIKELEKRNLGTKATRADILERLFRRGYIEGVKIKITKLGEETIIILEKYAPSILDEKLTVEFEEHMEKIRQGKEKQENVLHKAQIFLKKLLTEFKKKETAVGKEIIKSLRETQEIQNYVGRCKKCKEGKLMIRFGKFGKFIGCDKYPDCKTIFKLPHGGLVKGTEKECDACKFPKVQVIQKGKRPREDCINPGCPNKVSSEEKKEIKALEQHKIDKKCPNCGEILVVKSSFYGKLLACPGYPKCKHAESLESHKKFVKKKKK